MARVGEDKAEVQAIEWEEKAKAKLKGFSWFGSGATKYEDASESYIKAANIYKMAKKWDAAGTAYINAAECLVKAQSKHEAATNYINASNSLKKTNITESIKALKTAIELFTDEGRFSIAAKHQKDLAELYETEAQDLQSAMDSYQTAADYFEGENSTSSANACLLKVAQLAAQVEKYDKAIELYEQVARQSIDNNLLKWSVKEYFMKAGLCHLCSQDIISCKRALEKYQEMDCTFSSQRECKFLKDIIAAYENYDVEAFTQAVVEFDSISKLDAWKTSVLLRIKNSIKSEDQGLA